MDSNPHCAVHDIVYIYDIVYRQHHTLQRWTTTQAHSHASPGDTHTHLVQTANLKVRSSDQVGWAHHHFTKILQFRKFTLCGVRILPRLRVIHSIEAQGPTHKDHKHKKHKKDKHKKKHQGLWDRERQNLRVQARY